MARDEIEVSEATQTDIRDIRERANDPLGYMSRGSHDVSYLLDLVARLMGERDELAARVVSLEETLTAESRRLQQVAEDRNALAALLEDVANEASRPEVLADRARAILDRSTPE